MQRAATRNRSSRSWGYCRRCRRVGSATRSC